MKPIHAAAPVFVARLTAAHAPQYRALMLEAYEQAADAYTSTAAERAAEPAAWWVQRIADPQGLRAGFGAFDGGQLVGVVAIEFSTKTKTRHRADVISMYVQPSCRGAGVGRALMEAVMGHARSRPGTVVLGLTTTAGNEAAIRLYQAAGFEAWGMEPMAILTPAGYRAKVHMGCRLPGGDTPA